MTDEEERTTDQNDCEDEEEKTEKPEGPSIEYITEGEKDRHKKD